MRNYILVLLTCFYIGCSENSGSEQSATQVEPLSKGRPFSTVVAAPTAYLQIITVPTQDFTGEQLDVFSLSVQDGFLEWKQATANPTEDQNFWTGEVYPGGVLDTLRYFKPALGPINLKHFVRGEVRNSSNVLISSVEPLLYDAGETMPLSNPALFPYHESATFDGFWISARWVNLTSANNTGAYGDPFGKIRFPDPMGSGDYTLIVYLDPLNLWGQYTEYTIPFTISGATVTSAPFKVRGRK